MRTKTFRWFNLILFISLLGLALGGCGGSSSGGGNGGGTTYFEGTFGGTLISINSATDSFEMGDGSYGPDVTQTISYNFQMSKHEITNAQFQQFVDDGGYSNDSYWTSNGVAQRDGASWVAPRYWTAAKRGTDGANPNTNFDDDNQPVVGVAWYEAVAFSNWLSAKEGLTPAYSSSGQILDLSANGYRLPTEMEWEYAAAKGGSGQAERIYSYGNTWTCANVVNNDTGNGCSASQTANVGSIPAGDTPQGLSDMSGNVWEWISDNYMADVSISGMTDWYYFVDDQTTTNFDLRGGSWNWVNFWVFRGAYRYSINPSLRNNYIGFRVVRP